MKKEIKNNFEEFNKQSNAKEIDFQQLGLKKYYLISLNQISKEQFEKFKKCDNIEL